VIQFGGDSTEARLNFQILSDQVCSVLGLEEYDADEDVMTCQVYRLQN